MGSLFGGGGSDTQTTTSTQELPSYIEDPHKRLIGGAEQLAGMPYQPYPYDAIANLTPAHQAGLESIMGQAGFQQQALPYIYGELGRVGGGAYLDTPTISGEYMRGDPTAQGAMLNTPTTSGDYLRGDPTAQGAMLGANPYLDDMFRSASDAVTNRYLQTVQPGRSGQAVHQRSLGNTGQGEQTAYDEYQFGNVLSNMAANIYGGAYGQERGLQESARNRERQLQEQAYGQERGLQESARNRERQFQEGAYGQERSRMMQAMGLAPAMQQLGYGPGQAMAGVGNALQGQQQRELDYLLGQWGQAQGYPYMQQGHLLSTLGPGFGLGSRTQETPVGQADTATNILGLGLGGLGLAGGFGWLG